MNVTLVRDEGGDWIGLYVDGVLKAEGHSLNEHEVLLSVGVQHDTVWRDMSRGDRLPYKLSDLGDQDG